MTPEHIESIDELSPLQQDLLAQSLQAPGSGACVLQTVVRLSGRLDPAAFEQAWRWLVARHAALRTAFFWEDLETPRQVVFREVELAVERISWRGLDAAEQRERLDRALAADRVRELDLTEAPLLRLALFELGEDVHELVWTQHLLVTDGWSQGLLLRELPAAYEAFAAGREPVLPAARSFHDHLVWLRRQDLAAAEEFWRRRLAGFSTPTPLAAPGTQGAERREFAVPVVMSPALRAMARRHRLMPGVLVQAAWALVLAQEHGWQDVIFGVTVAGRSTDLPGGESIVGPLFNTLPLRVEVAAERRLGEWLAALQAHLVAGWRFEHTPLAEIRRWSDLPPGVALFDHVLAFESPALREAAAPAGAGLRVQALPGRELVLTLHGAEPEGGAPQVERLLARLVAVLGAFTVDGDPSLQEIPRLLQDERSQVLAEARHLAVEEVVAATLREVLGVSRVERQDSFFGLGGHSLRAFQVVSRLQARLGVEVSLQTLFEAPTVAALVGEVEALSARGREAQAPPLVPVPRDGDLPLSFAQQRLWFIDQLEPGTPLYNIPIALQIEGRLDPRLLERCLGEVVRRHEALRTVFAARDGAPVQRILPASPVPLPVVDLTGRPAAAEALARAEALRPFDLRRGPLLRGVLLRLGAGVHVLALTLHHIASDGWSMGILVREVAALYAAFAAGRPSPLPELPVQAADFAAWQHAWLQGAILEGEITFWRRQLADLPPLLELPTDRPRPAAQSFRGATRPVRVPAALVRPAEALGRSAGTTLFMVLLAGLQALLARLGEVQDLAVGTPVAGRHQVEVEGLIGFFVNTLVMRGDLNGTPSFRALLGRVRETALAAWRHQDVPFERLVQELAPERSRGHAPLFQVMLALQNAPVGELALPGLRLTPWPIPRTRTELDLDLTWSEGPEGLSGSLAYATDLFDGATMERWSGHLVRLLAEAVEHPDRPLAELSLLAAAERHQLLVEWSGAPAAEAGLFPGLFLDRARRTPEAVAVSMSGHTQTYRELALRARALAQTLRGLGVGPEVAVALCVDRSLDLPAALLGVLLAGGAYVPLDPALPRERLAFLLADCGASVVLAQEHLVERLPATAARVVLLEEVDPADPTDPPDLMSPEQAAYAIYTSGSTGQPKGAVISQGALASFAAAYVERLGLTAEDRVLQFAALGFDVVVEEIFPVLLAGGRIVLGAAQELATLHGLLRTIDEEGVTTVELPTAYWHDLVFELERTGARPPACLRRVLTGTERILPERLDAWRRFGVPLVHVFGLTEVTVTSLLHVVPAGEAAPSPVPPPVGRPFGGTRAWLLDEALREVPIGLPGELHLGGPGVARGYLGRPDLTAERFLPDPFCGTAGARMYRTGDRLRRLADGALEFQGRLDRQVKVRGFRIEPGEIEAALSTLPGVSQTVVLVREDRLIAYVAGTAEAAALREALREQLPEHMLPAAFVLLEALPLTPNGKVDRKALPAPEWQGAAGGYQAPRTPAEAILAGIWAELLGVERVGATDSFFELGGHSLLATRVLSRLREAFGVELPLRDLFEAPVLADLAARIEAARRPARPAASEGLVAVPRDAPLPLSFAQQRLWLIDQLEPGSPLYNIPVALRIEGALDAGVLARCLGEIVRRHEVLRTVFVARAGAPVQVILAAEPFPLPVVDLAGLPGLARRLAHEEAHRPFDLAHGPLLRGLLLRLAPGDHVIALTMHHIVSDGWSMDVLVREITQLYAAFAAGRPSPLPELPLQYADFAVWQRGWLQGEVLAEQIAFWKQRLAGAPRLLELPLDRPRPAMQTFRGATRPVVLAPVAELAALCRQAGVTPFMALLAAWALLLGRHAGQDDVVVGTPVAGRNRREIEDLIGFFVNTLALRIELGAALSFGDLLGRVREVALGAFAHQDLPFERLVEEVVHERDLAVSPLFQALFSFEKASAGPLRLAGLVLAPLGGEGTVAKFDLSLYLLESADGLAGALEYNTDLFDAVTAERWAVRYARLVAGAVADPGRPPGELPLLDPEEREQLLVTWNATAAPFPAERCVHDGIAAQVARTPEAPAVACAGEVWSYRALWEEAGRLAGELAALGVGPEERVAVRMERSPRMLAALLGVLRAGGAYVPLDPGHPAERLAFILEDAQVRAVVTDEALTPGPSFVCRRGAGGEVEPENLAYVIYTSGSTGRPKGVEVRHQGVVNYLSTMARRPGMSSGDVVVAVTTVSFDIAVTELLLPLTVGARIELVDRETAGDAARLAAVLEASGATFLQATPATWTMLLEGGWPGRAGLKALCGGEGFPRSLAEKLLPCVGELWNVYGPTETTVWSAAHRVTAGSGAVPVGLPLGNTAIHLVGRPGDLVPPGTAGELLIGGAGLARGYHGRPDLTAERFVPDPFGGRPGARLYRTGDLARRLPDGTLEILGRIDFQVKVRGFRIELGEIEAVLAAHPAVRACAAGVREVAGDRRLVAWVVGAAPSEELGGHLRERLPDYMVPSVFVTLDALPLTPNGKVDRKALPAPEPAGGAAAYVAPSDPVEELLAGLWAEVLGVERVGATDHFFALGGHSLLATRVMARLREAFGVELPLRRLFEAPVLADLARVVRASRTGAVAPPLVPVPRGGDLPLSFAQQRLWVVDRLEPGSPAYNMPSAVRLEGALDAGLLERVFAEIVRRHEALRTTFGERAGLPVQVIAPAAPVRLPLVDLAGLPGLSDRSDPSDPSDLKARQARLLARAEAARPFDLATGPLLRLTLVRLAAEEHLLLVTLHHIIADGWSQGVLVREIAALARAFAAGLPSPLPELPVQAADHAVWQRGWLHGAVLAEQLGFWTRRLAGAPQVLELPTDRPRPAVQTFRGGMVHQVLPPSLAQAVSGLARREAVTPFMALLAAWAVLLGRHAGQDDLLLGTPVAGRDRREVEQLIGLFVNTLVLRMELGRSTFRELLLRTRETALDAFAHQDVPFERLVEAIAAGRDLALSPLFQVLFALQNLPAGSFSWPGLTLTPVEMETGVARFDLSLYLTETPDGIAAALEHNTDLFDRGTAERLMARYAALLEGAAAEPGRAIGELPLLLTAERTQLLTAWNATDEPFPADRPVHELIGAQVARTPEAPAVSWAGEVWSYRALWEEAGRRADDLAALGVGPEERVAVRMERSPRLLAALLGVLRAGGAYVPLDPGHPAERLAFIVEDARVRALVTDEALTPGPSPASGRGENRPVAVDPENLAYVIYTSGSTGRPKGVEVRHRGVANYLATMARRPGMSAGDVVVALTTVSFDIVVTELLLPLTLGARIELVDRDTAGDAARLAAVLEASGATFLQATPATWTMLLDGGWPGRPGLKALCGGEAFPRALAEKLLPRVGELWNVYGPTETTVWSAVHRVAAGTGAVPVGLPLGNTTIHLVGRWGELVPPGAAGELLIGGAGLARGYHGRPDLTAERFVPDPFGDRTDRSDRSDPSDAFHQPGARLYRTGDLARRLPDGALEILGRIDFQVKVRGFRIELGEIEAVLAAHPAVRAAVAGVREVAGDRRLVAWVVGAAPAEELAAHLRERLPDYMVPSVLLALDALPLTPNGKVDRQALPAPQAAGAGAAYAAPADPVEELLAGLWAELLGVERVGRHDHFFVLGGHSLLATRLVSRLREACGVEVPLRRLFEAPTLAALARVVRESRAGSAAPPVVPVPRDVEPPLSFAQQRLWVIDRLEPGSAAYNMPFALRLQGTLAPALLERVFTEIVRRHEVLRTTFGERAGLPVQVIAPPAPVRLPVVDLAGLPGLSDRSDRSDRSDLSDLKARQARLLARTEAARPFDLAAGPLLRLTLLRLAADDHLLLVTLHHAVADGWSQGVLLREMAVLTAAFGAGRPSPLPELPVQYADFAVWQRGWLQGAVLEEQLGYWTQRLAGAPQMLELPADRPRPPVQTFRGALLPATLSPGHGLAALCRQAGVTPFMALLAAWGVLLGRHAGQDDLLVGSPVAGRNRRETEDLIGLFVNTLVFRLELGAAASFGALLHQVRETALGAFAHQELPFERLVEALVHERDLAVTPLFQVLFVLQNAPAGALQLPGLTVAAEEPEAGVARFDLSLYLAEAPEGFTAGLEHSTDLFDRATVERLMTRYAALLDGAVADPGRTLGDLPLLMPAETAQLVTGWNATAEPFPADRCVHELIGAQVALTPEAPAVTWAGETWSYRALWEEAGHLAGELAALGVGPEVLVAVRRERSPRLLAALLGVLRAGGAYVPLDPGHPQERLAFILEDAGVRAVVTEEGVEALTSGPLRGTADPENLAYVIYTSGSTGRPKGVGVRHRGVANYLATMARRPGMSPRDVVVALTTVSFDIAVTELLLPLAVGARIELVDRETAGDAARLAAVLESAGATFLQATPATWTLLLDGGWAGRPDLKALCGGEAFPRALAQRLLPRVGELWNVYGPTETTVWSAVHRVTAGSGAVPVGLPLGNTTIHLVGRWGELVPPGAAGELLIGGAGLARGYHGRPDLTAERFVPDPFGDRPGARLYRTGDLARRLPDGTLEVLGRIDFQVKVRGFRIELGEIEAVLAAHPAVRAAVAGVREVAGDRRLVVWVVAAAPAEELAAHLRERLPDYMVPSAFVLLDAFPLTPSGKVDRRALPAPEGGPGAAYEAPADPLEERLAALWGEVLGVERVGRRDHFFALGGHSLLATRLLSRLREALAVEVPLRRLFEAPTLAAFAAVVREARSGLDAEIGTPDAADLAALLDELDRLSDDEALRTDPRRLLERLAPPVPREDTTAPAAPVPLPRPAGETLSFPLSFAQQRLWFLDRLQPGNPVYNIPMPVRLRGALDPALLQRIFAEVIARHEALRTTFAEHEGLPVQVIAPPFTPDLPLIDLAGLPGPSDPSHPTDPTDPSDLLARQAHARQAHALAAEEAYLPFDLAGGPLLRLTLLRLAPADHVLLVTMHHIVSDGWSLGVLLREVAALWQAFAAGRPSPLPPLPLQYADFSVWQRQWLQGKVLAEQLAWWKARLAGAPVVLEMPTDRPRPALQTYRGRAVARRLPPAAAAALRELCRAHDATPFMALLGLWAVLLARHSGQEDVAVGTPVAGRHRRETVDLIGFFVNTVVVRVELGGAPDVRAVLERVRQASLGAFIHQDLPFERIVEELVAERDPSHAPLFQVMFALQQSGGQPDVALPELDLAPVEVESRMAKFDLTLNAADEGDGFATTLDANADLFDATTAGRLLDRFAELLTAATAEPGRPVRDLPLLPAAERHQTLCEWNDGTAVPPAPAAWGELFAAVAHRLPESPAVISSDGGADGEVWSYRRLDEAANRLAHRLRALGVGLDQAVGLCVERSPELIVGIVAVLKAGGVYLPLNPEHPDDRLRFQVEDTGARVILVHARTRHRLEGCTRIEIDPAALATGAGETAPPAVRVPAESLAYIIYTSGSTGLPKGVGVPHQALLDHAASIVEEDSYTPDDRVIQFASLSFDVSIEQIFPTLLAGAALVLRGEELARPEAMFPEFRRLGITIANLPTAYWQQAVRELPEVADPPDPANPTAPPLRLRMQTVGGEAMLPDAARRWVALTGPLGLGGVCLVNGYGPTETVVTATRFDVSQRGAVGTASVLIGRLLPLRTAYVVDARGHLQPPGVPGELLLGGILARGYVNRPELTAERFVPDPFGAVPGGRLYRTGDLVRQLPEGDLDYLGRIDRQVKIRGFRIEPGEIEAALIALPGVRDCAVVARRDGPAGDRLVAYVVPASSGAGLTALGVREALKKSLPDYMLPAATVFLDALPLTANGKVDRKALPAPGRAAAEGREPEAARDALELRLVQIWEELLDVPVGLRDNFFALGGHSLLAVRLVGAIERQLGVRVPLAALMAAPTVEQLAHLLRAEVRLERTPLVPIETAPERGGSRPPLFLVHPVGGNVFCYLPLVRGAALDGPVFGLQAPDPGTLDPWTIESLAACYVAALREVQPEGPYRLAGWSLGGVVAWEMARRLTAEGSEVPFLALIDPGAPQTAPEAPDPDRALAQFLSDLGGQAGLDPAVHRGLPAGATLDSVLAREEVRALLPPDVTAAQIHRLFDLFRANVRALESWVPRPYAGRPTLLRAAASVAAQPEAAEAWSALAEGGAEVHVLPGDHYSLVRAPHVAALAQHLAAALRRLDGAPATPAERRAALSPAKRELLAAVLRERRAEDDAIRPRGTTEPAPLSLAQERMWFLHQLDPQSAAYNVHLGLRLEGTLHPQALAAALAGLQRRHQVLCTRYEQTGAQPVQVVELDRPAPLPLVDLSGLPADTRGALFPRLQSEEGGRPFDLVRGPVLRALLVRLAPAEHALFLTIHHIATDGWSRGLMLKDLAALYAACAAGVPPELPPQRLQVADFAAWQRRRLQGEVLEEQLAWWRRQLAPPLPMLQLPVDHPREAQQAYRGGLLELTVPADLTSDLRAFAQARGATLFMVLLAGLSAVLQRSGGDRRLLVGAPVAGRTRVEVEDLVGFFLNTLVLPVDLDGDPSFAALVDRAAHTALGAFAHQDLPLETLLQRLRLERGPRGPFQVLLLLQNLRPPAALAVPGLTLRPLTAGWQVDLGTNIQEISLTVEEHGPALVGELDFNALLFDPATIRRLLDQMRTLLRGAVAAPATPLSVLPLLTAEEESELLAALPPGEGRYVTDPALRPVPVGVIGELLAAGTDGRLLRTGERVRRRADGTIEPVAPEPVAAPEALPVAERQEVAPRNETEEIIAEIWCELLGLDTVSVFDSFFELGGHSLLLRQVMQRLQDAFDVEIPLRSIYEERTIAGLAVKIEELLIDALLAEEGG